MIAAHGQESDLRVACSSRLEGLPQLLIGQQVVEGGLEDHKLLDQVSEVAIYSQELQRFHHLDEMSEFWLLVKLIRGREKKEEIRVNMMSLLEQIK